MSCYKAVLFDLDGTLLDTLEDITDSMNQALTRFGLGDIGISDIRRLVGNGARKLAEGVSARVAGKAPASGEMTDRLLDVYNEIYNKNSAIKTKPYAGVQELLDWLKDQGIRTGVLSNKPHLTTLEVLRHYFPRHAFDFAAGQRDGVPRKPNPAGVYEFCGALGISPDEVLFVGDSEVDLETGRNAGVDCVGVLWGFRDEEILIKCGAKALIKTPEEIKDFLRRGSY
ncbi:MAG: HAD family hydrolase [Clostridiales bacterium]|jgi:phosphoglycolate phosphatase|nr:HAD family hydrolase [Clostridiales bacterium]